MDEKEMQISQDCLGLPTILRHVLQQFSTNDLIKLSLVNKLWNFEARSVMRQRGNSRAKISSDEDCQKLAAFASDLENMRVIPFSGIYVNMHDRRPCQSISNGLPPPSYKAILNRLPRKYFAVSFCNDHDREYWQNCPARILVKKILANFCGVLEELSLQHGKEEFYQSILQDWRFPCLKTLKVAPRGFYEISDPLTSTFIKALVSRAPKLQELHIDGEINLKENLLQGSSAVLVLTHILRPLYEKICEGLIGSLRASTIEIRIQDEEIDPQLLHRVVPMVLQSSRSTLKTLYTDLRIFVPLMCSGICLQNVTTLQIHMNGNTHDNIGPTLELLRGSGFTRMFPKLKEHIILDDFDQKRSYIWMKQAQSSPLNLKLH